MRIYKIVLSPRCEIGDDRECDCGQHATYEFAGIHANTSLVAIDIAYHIVEVTPESHSAVARW